jgi:hypothetical protein
MNVQYLAGVSFKISAIVLKTIKNIHAEILGLAFHVAITAPVFQPDPIIGSSITGRPVCELIF